MEKAVKSVPWPWTRAKLSFRCPAGSPSVGASVKAPTLSFPCGPRQIPRPETARHRWGSCRATSSLACSPAAEQSWPSPNVSRAPATSASALLFARAPSHSPAEARLVAGGPAACRPRGRQSRRRDCRTAIIFSRCPSRAQRPLPVNASVHDASASSAPAPCGATPSSSIWQPNNPKTGCFWTAASDADGCRVAEPAIPCWRFSTGRPAHDVGPAGFEVPVETSSAAPITLKPRPGPRPALSRRGRLPRRSRSSPDDRPRRSASRPRCRRR